MAKSNQKIRDEDIGQMNWWDYLESIRPRGFRNIPQLLDYDEILFRTKQIEAAEKDIKNRKRQEKKLLKAAKFKTNAANLDAIIKAKKTMTVGKKKRPHQKISGQIQRGYDIAGNSKRECVIYFEGKRIVTVD